MTSPNTSPESKEGVTGGETLVDVQLSVSASWLTTIKLPRRVADELIECQCDSLDAAMAESPTSIEDVLNDMGDPDVDDMHIVMPRKKAKATP